MEITEKKIVNVLTNIMTRLDDLEFAQHQHKKMFYKVKKRLLELNDNLNDILDVLEGEDMETVDVVKTKYSELILFILKNLLITWLIMNWIKTKMILMMKTLDN